ncbi:MFS transporter [Nocardia aurantia]|uniref:Putative MFS-type transporter EfpA n=1 Tax=Nocardia aurantia TaxID=2585199 RepID=A0A7K0DY63_9NOCA|nr:MFS transporter [Nocardia aurantia]MQY30740.1 putative MFS-type transporter EfpA [Nocardia aurantia]
MLDNPAATTTQYPVTNRAFGLPILVLSGLQLMVILDGTVVIFAIPRLQEQLGLSSSASAWTVTAYGLPYAGLMLLGGRLGDSFGRKRMLILGVGLFTIASALCGTAQTDWMLIGARALQGAGAAIAAPTAMALVASTFEPGPVRNKAIAIFGSMAGVGSIGGLVVGGALTQFSWRWIFWINVPIGLLIAIGAVLYLRDTEHHRLALDARGAVLGTLGCVGIVFGATEGPDLGWHNPVILGSASVGLLLLIAFILSERYAGNPLLPWSLFGSRDRVATLLALLLAGGGMGAMTFYVAQFLQNVLGFSPLIAGVAAIPFTLGVGIGSAIATKLALMFRPRWLLSAAGVVLAAGLLFGSTLDQYVDYSPTLVSLLMVIGFGVGVMIVLIPLCLLVGVPPSNVGPLTAIGQMALSLGGPIAVGMFSPIALSRTLSLGGRRSTTGTLTTSEISALSSGYTLVLFICAVLSVVFILIVLTIRYTPGQLAEAQHAQEEAQQT